MQLSSIHQAVMIQEVLDGLEIKADGRYLDGTLGGAAHTRGLLERSAPNGRVLSLDVDPKALRRAEEALASYGSRWQGKESNFRFLDHAASEGGLVPLDGILLDLGFSSDELMDAQKGLSFLQEGPLDMRLGPKANEDGLTAADIVNTWSQDEIEAMIRTFGEERMAGRIARAIVEARKAARIIGTLDLVAVIRRALPAGYERGRIHPATRTFQALRIAVNDELETLKDAIAASHRVLKDGGILGIITFHSLEDGIVKRAFKETGWQPLTKKPLIPSEVEIVKNPRARSAKLRLARKHSL